MLEATVSKDSNSKYGDTESFVGRVLNLRRQMDGLEHTESFEENSSAYFTETKVGQNSFYRLSTVGSDLATPGQRKAGLGDDEAQPVGGQVGSLCYSTLIHDLTPCKVQRGSSGKGRNKRRYVEDMEIVEKVYVGPDLNGGGLNLQRNLESGQGYGGFPADGGLGLGLRLNCVRPQVVMESRREWDGDDSPIFLKVKKGQTLGCESPGELS
jgi:hypothetical protein